MIHPHDLWYDPWTIRILAFARGLKQRGHTVYLCHLPRKEKPSHQPLRSPCSNDPAIVELRPRQQHIVHNYNLISKLAKECDIIHIQKCFASTSLPSLWLSRNLKKPLHYDWDDDETAISNIVEKRFLSRLQIKVFERILPSFAHTISCSSFALRDRAAALGFPADRMWHIPVGADTERFTPRLVSKSILRHWGVDSSKTVILYVGQLEGAAHADLLIHAAPLVLQKRPSAEFLIVGGGEQEAVVRALARNSPHSHAIHFTGYIEAAAIPDVIAAADICVASFADTPAARAKSPLKIAEYMASGKPVVASKVGDVPWMVQGCGLSVEPGDPAALAEGIVCYLDNLDKRIDDGFKARQRAVQHFVWEKGVETLLQAYSFSIGNSKTP